MLHGVDIHGRYQRGLIASNLHNVDFVITKATGGKNFVIKRTYNANGTLRQNAWEDMLSGAELVGIYHYAKEKGYAGTAAEEAANFIAQANKRPDAVLFLDWEEDDKNDADWALEWLRLVEAGTGRKPLFYTYHAILKANPALSRIQAAGYKLWYARYPYSVRVGWRNYDQPTTVPYWGQPLMWQYSSAGGLDDYSSPLDLNIFYGDASDWKSLAIVPKPATTSTLYTRAIDGKFQYYTIRSWQSWLTRRGYYTGAISGTMDPESWKAVQRWLKKDDYYNRAIDGNPGEWTIKGIQQALQNAGYYTGFKVDGVFGKETIKALQEYLSTYL